MTTDSRHFDPLADQVERNAELDSERHPVPPDARTVRVHCGEADLDYNLEQITGKRVVKCTSHLPNGRWGR
jgi:hypothetical protein